MVVCWGNVWAVAFTGADSENNQTITQLLVEMDGFNSNDDIIIIGATNRKDMIDEGILRPGRFDIQIEIPRPDVEGRKKIIESQKNMRLRRAKEYAKKKKKKSKKIFEKNIDLKKIALATPHFSGADKNLQ